MRRSEEDPVLSEHVRERLAHLLAEQRPRRAHADPAASPVRPSPAERSGPPEFLPSEDADELEVADEILPRQERWSSPATISSDLEVRTARGSALAFGRAHLGVVAALLVVGLLCAGWAVLRARPVAMANPIAVPSVAPDPSVSRPRAATPASASPVPQIMVHVLGAVRKPGVVSVPQTARVRDALTAAGGLTSAADPGELNLAQVLADGQQIVIGTERDPTGEVRSGSPDVSGSSGSAGTSDVLDLNRATETQLEQLPGVGPVTAGKIVAWRTEHGRFSRVEELQEVDGIGPKTYAEIAPHARV